MRKILPAPDQMIFPDQKITDIKIDFINPSLVLMIDARFPADPIRRIGNDRINLAKRWQDFPTIAENQSTVAYDFFAFNHGCNQGLAPLVLVSLTLPRRHGRCWRDSRLGVGI